jgi:endonuclease YncB( thermonuclease family)
LIGFVATLSFMSSSVSAGGYKPSGLVTQVVDGDTLYVTVAEGGSSVSG